MNTATFATVLDALDIAAANSDDPARFEKVRRELGRELWEVEIWKGGELYSVLSDSDPCEALRKMALYVSDGDVDHDGDPLTMWEQTKSRWYDMDISFVAVKRWAGPVVLEEGTEEMVVAAARAAS